jgi:hypothetical protein
MSQPIDLLLASSEFGPVKCQDSKEKDLDSIGGLRSQKFRASIISEQDLDSIGGLRWVRIIRPPSEAVQLRQTDPFVETCSLLSPDQGARLVQTPWIHFLSSEQLCGMALCGSQLFAVNRTRAWIPWSIQILPSSNHVHSLHRFC